jgi:hypothetical protein
MPGRVNTRLGRSPDDSSSSIDRGGATAGPGVLAPFDVGHQVVAAVRANQLFVFTHPERVAEVRRRFDRITDGGL